MAQQFEVWFGGTVDLSEHEIWPNGDGPEDPTVEDVIDLMTVESDGDILSLLGSWGLVDHLKIYVEETLVDLDK